MAASSAPIDPPNGGDIKNGSVDPLELIEYDQETQAYGHITRTDLEPEDMADVEDEEKARPSGKPQHAGFWEHSMVNVRLHVLKLWTRTGEGVFHLMFVKVFGYERLLMKNMKMFSFDTFCRNYIGSVSV